MARRKVAGVKGTRTHLQIEWLHQHATLRRPVLQQAVDKFLETHENPVLTGIGAV